MLRILALLLALASAPAFAQQRELTVVGFGGGFQDAARKALFQPFAAAAGIAVRDDTYNGEMARIYAMVRNRDVVWDLVMVEAPELARGCEDGVFAKIDWAAMGRERFIPAGVADCGVGAVAWGAAVFWDTARTPNGPSGPSACSVPSSPACVTATPVSTRAPAARWRTSAPLPSGHVSTGWYVVPKPLRRDAK